jgi:hypothetical protein
MEDVQKRKNDHRCPVGIFSTLFRGGDRLHGKDAESELIQGAWRGLSGEDKMHRFMESN